MRLGVSEFELRNPFAAQMNPQYLRSLSLTYETITDASLYPSLRDDVRNVREQLYKMWCGYPMIVNHKELDIPTTIDTINNRIIPHKQLPWYSRFKREPPITRFLTTNQLEIEQDLNMEFHYDGFKFAPEYNKQRREQPDPYFQYVTAYETLDDHRISSLEETVDLPTTKKIEEILISIHHHNTGGGGSSNRGLQNSSERTIYIGNYRENLVNIYEDYRQR